MEDVEKNSEAEPNTQSRKTDQEEATQSEISNIDNNSCQSPRYLKTKQLLYLY